MSKSKGNHIGITDAPDDMFGKVMSISDETMILWYDLLSDRPPQPGPDGRPDPLAAKKALAYRMVTRFHGASAAEDTLTWWNAGRPARNVEAATAKAATLPGILVDAQMASSKRDARQKVEQGGVSVDGAVIADPNHKLIPGKYMIAVGKKSVKQVKVTEA
jgi:tyrosyl-tRNA synthetase